MEVEDNDAEFEVLEDEAMSLVQIIFQISLATSSTEDAVWICTSCKAGRGSFEEGSGYGRGRL